MTAPKTGTAPVQSKPMSAVNAMFAPAITGEVDLVNEVDDLIAASRLATQIIDLALGDGLTAETLAARWPGTDFAQLLDDPAIARRVELLAQDPVIQRMASDMVARKNVNVALAIMSAKLADPDCNPGQAQAIAELSLKQAAQSSKAPSYTRVVRFEMAAAHIETVFGRNSISTYQRAPKTALIEVIKAARCLSAGEVAAVIDVLKTPMASVTLAGW